MATRTPASRAQCGGSSCPCCARRCPAATSTGQNAQTRGNGLAPVTAPSGLSFTPSVISRRHIPRPDASADHVVAFKEAHRAWNSRQLAGFMTGTPFHARSCYVAQRREHLEWHLSGAAHFHLATSMRSFRAENLSRFVRALLNSEAEFGRELFAEFRDRYSVVRTRSIREARRWIAPPPAAGGGVGRSRGLLIGAADQARGDLLLLVLLPSLGSHRKTRPPPGN